MPTNAPTDQETYIYDHRQYPGSIKDTRQFQGSLHNPEELPAPTNDYQTSPLIMIEPFHPDNGVYLHFRGLGSITLNRQIAMQLKEALAKFDTA